MVFSCNATSSNDSSNFLLVSIIALLTPKGRRTRICCEAVSFVGIADKSPKRKERIHKACRLGESRGGGCLRDERSGAASGAHCRDR